LLEIVELQTTASADPNAVIWLHGTGRGRLRLVAGGEGTRDPRRAAARYVFPAHRADDAGDDQLTDSSCAPGTDIRTADLAHRETSRTIAPRQQAVEELIEREVAARRPRPVAIALLGRPFRQGAAIPCSDGLRQPSRGKDCVALSGPSLPLRTTGRGTTCASRRGAGADGARHRRPGGAIARAVHSPASHHAAGYKRGQLARIPDEQRRLRRGDRGDRGDFSASGSG